MALGLAIGPGVVSLSFDTPPTVPLWRTVVKRRSGGDIPRIEASAKRLVGEASGYSQVCGLADVATLPVCFPDLLCRGLQLTVLTDARFPLGLMGIVHARQRIDQRRAILADEPLSGRVWVEGQRTVRKGGEFDMHTVVSAHDGAVWHGVTTIFTRELPGDGVERPAPPPSPFVPSRSATWRLPEALGRRYAAVSGDANPIHQYAWTAKLFGVPRAIIHGWWTLARALGELDLAPGSLCVEARFLSPLLLPSTAWFAAGDGVFTVGDGRRLGVIGTAR